MNRLILIHSIAWGWMNEIKAVNPQLSPDSKYCDFVIENIMDKVCSRFKDWVEHFNDTQEDTKPMDLELTSEELEYIVLAYKSFIYHYKPKGDGIYKN
jgi:hypothetical protein